MGLWAMQASRLVVLIVIAADNGKLLFFFTCSTPSSLGCFFVRALGSRVYPAGSLCRVGLLVITINSFVSYAVTVRVRLTAVSSRRCSSRWRTT